jgi:hypothetical protein
VPEAGLTRRRHSQRYTQIIEHYIAHPQAPDAEIALAIGAPAQGSVYIVMHDGDARGQIHFRANRRRGCEASSRWDSKAGRDKGSYVTWWPELQRREFKPPVPNPVSHGKNVALRSPAQVARARHGEAHVAQLERLRLGASLAGAGPRARPTRAAPAIGLACR